MNTAFFLNSFFSFLTLIFFLSVSIPSAQAATATSNCVITNIGNPPASLPLPEGCGTMRQGIVCPPNEPKYVCAYRNIVDHNVRPDGSYWDWHPPGHMGVDLIARANTPIYALENGIIIQSYYDYGCGNIVKIQDVNRRFHLNCHLIRPGIAKNTPVKRGDIIGYVGHTGANTSPTDHVHYQISYPCNSQYNCWSNPEVILKNWPNY